MSHRWCTLTSLFALCSFLPAAGAGLPQRERMERAVLASPLHFEVNHGQAADPSVRFIARGPAYTLLLSADAAAVKVRGAAVRMRLVGANPNARGSVHDRMPGVSNYLVGKDPSKWRTGVPVYARVRFEEVYPGISLVYYGSQRMLEYDLIVAPGADPDAIRLEFDGAQGLRIDASGDLVIDSPSGELRQRRPVIYQWAGAERRSVEGRYVVEDERRVRFQIARYDRRSPLVIDPVVVFSTTLGGTSDDGVFDVATDAQANLYATGVTGSAGFPTTTGVLDRTFQPTVVPLPGAFGEAFVTKYSPDGKTIFYSTYLGGSDGDGGNAIAVDSEGNVVVVGGTASPDFPTTANGYRRTLAGPDALKTDLFITKLDKNGAALLYSTYFGSPTAYMDFTFEGTALALDSAGKIYIGGQATANDMPTRTPAQGAFSGGDFDGYVAKFDPAATGNASLVYGTFLGGSGRDSVLSLAVDSQGNAYARGGTCSTNFPVTQNSYQNAKRGACDAFLTKISPGGNQFLYSTYIGGSQNEYGELASGSAGPIEARPQQDRRGRGCLFHVDRWLVR